MLQPDPETSWAALGARWPNREASRFVDAAGLRWHVQLAGSGPVLLLVHGTGAATHSWRDLLPRLAARWTVVAPDLPGHGFTTAPDASVLSLSGMRAALGGLLRALGLAPVVAVGHSAGAAVIARMTLDGEIAPRLLVGLNPALVPPPALYTHLLAPVVNAVATTEGTANVAARIGARFAGSMLRSTNSRLDAEQEARYATFLGSPAHAQATLTMMAGWDLPALERDLGRLTVPFSLVTGRHDHWVPQRPLRALARRIPHARLVELEEEGHLFHEAHPDVAEREIEAAARLAPVAPPRPA